jgi:glycosyltransferase involved in cell wall biosynthesis
VFKKNKIMKIAVLADQYFNASGVGVYTRELIKNLLEMDVENNYVVLYPGKSRASQIRLNAPNAHVLPLPERKWLYPLWHFFGWPVIETFVGDVDLVHYITGSVRIPCKASYLVGVTDLTSERYPKEYPWRRRWFKHRMLEDIQERKAFVIAISNFTKRDVIELTQIPKERIFVTQLGVDQVQFRPSSNSEHNNLEERYKLPRKFFLFMGAISPRKNIEILFEAFERLLNKVPEIGIDLVIAGPAAGWKNRDAYKHWKVMRQKSKVHWIGYVEQSDFPAIINAALALVYPSRYEGFGLPVLEAMACGTPVICSNTSSLPEVAGNAAIMVSPNDVNELVSAMALIVLHKSERDLLIQKGVQHARQFSWEATARKTLVAYRQVVGG